MIKCFYVKRIFFGVGLYISKGALYKREIHITLALIVFELNWTILFGKVEKTKLGKEILLGENSND